MSLWEGGSCSSPLASLRVIILRRRSPESWLLVPSVLLVQQIPYRAMSLGLKAVIRRGSRYACLQMCRAAWASRLAVGPSPSLLDWGGILGRATLGGASVYLPDSLLDSLIRLCSGRLCRGLR